MTSVQLQQIDQTLGGRPILRGLDLRVDAGEYLVLLGPSGCGKTTTLRIIAGLQQPDRGRVLMDGQCVNKLAPRLRDVSMVFQHDALYPHLTVDQSMRFGLKRRIGKEELQQRIAEAVSLARIDAILDRYPSRLSGGELRRAALAKSIARHASVRLLDEPLSALDVPVRHALQDDILRWHATVPGTTIHVTHDGQEAMRMADRIAVMEAGRIVQVATPIKIFSHPQTISVAQAVGAPPINLLQARSVGDKVTIGNPAIGCQVHVGRSVGDRDVVVGVRPESWSADPIEGQAGLELTGRVVRSQHVQSDLHVQIKAGENTLLVVMRAAPRNDAFQPGQKLSVRARREDIHVFDARSGCRIEQRLDR